MNKIIEKYSEITMRPIATGSKRQRIVMLLGAGFSIDQGYPKASDVAERLAKLSSEQFFISTDGVLCEISEKPNDVDIATQESIYHKTLLLLIDLIDYYYRNIKREGNFNYEDFYDIINIAQRNRFKNKEFTFDIFSKECRSIANRYTTDFITFEQLLRRMPIVYSQLIELVIREKGNTSQYYNDVASTISCYPQYSNFLRFLKEQSVSSNIDVFTLNHDLFFESFSKIPKLQDDIKHCSLISDGFDDYGSEYYGIIKIGETNYKCRLERYTGRYNAPIRLYKLHGSFDYVLCYKTVKTKKGNYAVPIKYVKSKKDIMPFEYYKSTGCKMRYDLCLTDCCESFLSGTESKVLQYADRLLYAKLFKRFDNCLRNADRLIIIGYSGNDTEINDRIKKYFNSTKGKGIIIDYQPGERLKDLARQIKANILQGKINEQIKNVDDL